MWFPLGLISALFWGGSDLFSKMGTDPRDKYSHLKLMIAVGGTMGVVGVVLLFIHWNSFDPLSILRYLPVSFLYIFAMLIGYIGLRYMELSVSSPICNCSGAVAALLCFLFLGQDMAAAQFVAVGFVIAGIVLLSVCNMRDESKARRFRGEHIEEKYQISLLAVMIPIFYCLIDALGTFGDAYVLDNSIKEMDAEIAYYLTFLFCAMVAFLYLVVVKKQKLIVREEREKEFAALCETAGQFFYVYAIANNAVLAAPLISAYCVFSLIFSRIFLKEKLTRRQYASIAVVLAGVVVMGFYGA